MISGAQSHAFEVVHQEIAKGLASAMILEQQAPTDTDGPNLAPAVKEASRQRAIQAVHVIVRLAIHI